MRPAVLFVVLGTLTGAARLAADDTPKKAPLKDGARVAVVGDSITEQKLYSKYIADYLYACTPQLHAHVFAFNATRDAEEGRWKAGQFRGLKADAPYFQAGFRVRLADKLQGLGFAVERKRDDFEIAGVPASTIKRFSRRTEAAWRSALW